VHAIGRHRDVVRQDRKGGCVRGRATWVAAAVTMHRVAVVLTGNIESTVGITGVLAIGRNRLLEAPSRAIHPLVLDVAAHGRHKAVRPCAVTVVGGERGARGPALEVSSNEDANRVDRLFAHVHRDGDHRAVKQALHSAATRVAAVVADHRQGGIRLDRIGTVRKSVDCAGAGLAAGEFFLGRPPVEGELVLNRIRSDVDRHRVDAVRIGVVHGDASSAPTGEAAVEVHSSIGTCVFGHVHLEGHGVRGRGRLTGAVRAALLVAGADGRVLRHRCQNPIVPVPRIRAGQPGQILLGSPIIAVVRAVEEDVVAGGARCNRHGHAVRAVSIIVRHGVGHGISKDPAAEEHAVRAHRDVFRVHVERDIVHVVGAAATVVTVASVTAVVADHRERGVRRDVVGPVREAVNRARAGLASGEFLLSRPSVEGELVFNRAFGDVDRHRVDAVAIGIIHGDAATAPSGKAAVQVDRTIGARVLGHVHLEGDGIGSRGRATGSVRAALTEAGAVGRRPGHCRQDPVIVVSGIGAGQTGQVLLGSPIATIVGAVEEDVVSAGSFFDTHGYRPNAVGIVVGHGVRRGVSEHTATEVHAVRTHRDGLGVHVEREVIRRRRVLLLTGAAVVEALHVEDHVRRTEVEAAVAEAVTGDEIAIRAQDGALVATPTVDHVLELIALAGSEGHVDRVDVVAVVVRHGSAGTAPTVKGTRHVDGLRAGELRIGHVHLERHDRLVRRRLTSAIGGALAEAGADGGVLRDVAQQAVGIGTVRTGLPVDVLLATPVRAVAVEERVVAGVTDGQSLRDGPDVVAIIVAHRVVPCDAEVSATCEEHTVGRGGLVGHVDIKCHVHRAGCGLHNDRSHHAIGGVGADAAVILIGAGRVQGNGPHGHRRIGTAVGPQGKGLGIVPSVSERAGHAVHVMESRLIEEFDGLARRHRQGGRVVVVIAGEDRVVLGLSKAEAEYGDAKQQKVTHGGWVTVRFFQEPPI